MALFAVGAGRQIEKNDAWGKWKLSKRNGKAWLSCDYGRVARLVSVEARVSGQPTLF